MGQESGKQVLLPEVLGESREAEGIVLVLRIPEELAYFTGHFDEIAVVPGVAQIQWAVYFARRHLGLDRSFSHMEVIKFKELLLPGQRLELSLCYRQALGKLKFSYRSETYEFSSGRIYFNNVNI